MEREPSLSLIAYRYESTGPSGLDYYKGRDLFLSCFSSVTPGFSAKIEIAGKRFASEFDLCTTLFPGLARIIYEPYLPENREAARIVLMENGECKIVTPTETCYVKQTVAGFAFYLEEEGCSEPIAEITQIVTCDWIPEKYFDIVEPAYEAKIYGTRSLLLVMGILSYPALRFV
ncbi:MAG: hypothetical protein IJ744_04465 [Lachnospiraceae bacterium]|nr:hypothetical protein [Lachnospiraceae bacterium]